MLDVGHDAARWETQQPALTQSQVPPLRLDLGLELRRAGERKPFAWLLYHAGQHYRLRVPSYLLVVTNDPAVAAWAAGPFSSGMVTMRPLVITPAHFPPITDPEEAKRPAGVPGRAHR
jgi:hypothetical protein